MWTHTFLVMRVGVLSGYTALFLATPFISVFDEDMDVSDTTESITNKYIFQNYCVYRIWFGDVREQVQERGQPGYHTVHGDHQREVQPCMWVGPKPCKPRMYQAQLK